MQTLIKGKSFEVAAEPSDYWKWIAEGRYNHEWAVYDAHLKPEHTFIDLGAWVGGHSLYASTIAKKVAAVEPDLVAYEILLQNVGTLKNVKTFCNAISNEPLVQMGSGFLGASTTRTNPSAGSGIGPWVEGHTFWCAATTLRRFAEHYCENPLFIKIDVEGSEEEILKDAAFFAERKPTLLLELHPFWWRDAEQTWKDFEAVKALYKTAREVPHPNSKTWVMYD